MGMQINTNMAALNAYRNLNNTQNDLSKSLEKLSSGFRINRAADDAAGLAISEGLKSQIGGLTVASRNAQDGISVIQTAEGSLAEVHTILQRMRDLAVQAGNDSNSAEARTSIGNEVDSLKAELTRISEATNFNGINLLDGSKASLDFQVGADNAASSKIQVDLSGANIASVVSSLGFGSTTVTSGSIATGSLTLGSAEDYEFVQGSTTVSVNVNAANVAGVATALNANAGFSQNFTAAVDSTTGGLLVTSKTPGAGNITYTIGTPTGTLSTVATAGFDSNAAAQASIGLIDTAITTVSSARAELGAQQNRFESAVRSLAVTKENLTAANSRIRDVDMAEEMVNFTKSQILSQAGTAMLAQANQSNQGVLQLLR